VIEEVDRKVYHCICERTQCRHDWYAWEKPDRCAKCKSRAWNGSTRTKRQTNAKWIRVKQCTVCGGIDWIKDEQGKSVCAHCAADKISTRGKKKAPAKSRQ